MPERDKTKLFSTFEVSLLDLQEECKSPVGMRKILRALSGKGKTLLLVFLCLPFGQILGLAFVFGLLIAFLGFKMAFHSHRIWLPQWILKKKIPGKLLKKIIRQILWPLKKMRHLTHPRHPFFWKSKGMQKINGALIGVIGVCLAISLPIPLSSWIATIAIFLLGLGLLNDDGLLIAIAYPVALLYIGFVIVSLEFISLQDMIMWVKDHIFSLFS